MIVIVVLGEDERESLSTPMVSRLSVSTSVDAEG